MKAKSDSKTQNNAIQLKVALFAVLAVAAYYVCFQYAPSKVHFEIWLHLASYIFLAVVFRFLFKSFLVVDLDSAGKFSEVRVAMFGVFVGYTSMSILGLFMTILD